jgi:hypothetical protein
MEHKNFTRGDREIPLVVTYWWAMLLARVYEVFSLVRCRCGESMRIIAFVRWVPFTAHLGEPTQPPRIAPARPRPLPLRGGLRTTPKH